VPEIDLALESEMRERIGFRQLAVHAAAAEHASLTEESAAVAAVNAWAAAGCTPDAPEEIEAAEELAAAVSAFDIDAARLANNRMSCREELACFRDTFCLLVTITLIAATLFILNDAGEVRGLPHMPIPSAYECLPPAPHPPHPPTHPTRHPRSAYLHLSSCTARGVTLTFNAAYLSCPRRRAES